MQQRDWCVFKSRLLVLVFFWDLLTMRKIYNTAIFIFKLKKQDGISGSREQSSGYVTEGFGVLIFILNRKLTLKHNYIYSLLHIHVFPISFIPQVS